MRCRITVILLCYLGIGLYPLISQDIMNKLKTRGLRTTIYKVDDLSKAKNWYAKAFGITPYFDEPFYVGFNIAGYELGLLPEKVTIPKTTNVLTYWSVDDITDAYDLMITNGAKELESPNDVGGGVKVALVKDPWDNVIGLIYNPHFKIQHPESTCVEWAPFSLKNGITHDQLKQVSERLVKEFLIHQPGFIKKELLKQDNHSYVDLVYWQSEEAAKSAFERSQESDVANEYFALMLLSDEAPLVHYQMIQQ